MNDTQGCVYFFKHKRLKPIKIGFTNNKTPIGRLNQFATYAPYGVEMIGYFRINNASKIEKLLHKKYKKYRLNGEWFDINIESALDEINKYKKKEIIFTENIYYDEYNFKSIFDEIKYDVKILNTYIYNLTDKTHSKKRLFMELVKYCESKDIQITKFNSNGVRKFKLTKI